MLKARTRKTAPLLCAAASLLALIGIILGLVFDRPLWIVVLLLPAAVYELIRTEGRSTRAASAILLVVLLALGVLLVFDVSFDLAAFFGAEVQTVAGYRLPLADVKVVAPALMAILSRSSCFCAPGARTPVGWRRRSSSRRSPSSTRSTPRPSRTCSAWRSRRVCASSAEARNSPSPSPLPIAERAARSRAVRTEYVCSDVRTCLKRH